MFKKYQVDKMLGFLGAFSGLLVVGLGVFIVLRWPSGAFSLLQFDSNLMTTPYAEAVAIVFFGSALGFFLAGLSLYLLAYTQKLKHTGRIEAEESLRKSQELYISRLRQAEKILRQVNAELEGQVLEKTKELDQAIQNRDSEIAARRNAEIELAKRSDELATSNQELDQFALVASHDLQEPLRKISSYGDLLIKRYRGQLDEKADLYMNYMIDGIERMQNLIKGLLAYARIGKSDLPMRPVDLNGIVRQSISDFESVIHEKGAQVNVEPLPTVIANPAQMEQLFQNLISNGLKFCGKEPPRIHIWGEPLNDEWVVAVKDNGIGIEKQYEDRIFQIFQRLQSRKDYPGTGIGLSICKKILERHGGRIWVQSIKGGGTTFLFALPAKTKELVSAPVALIT